MKQLLSAHRMNLVICSSFFYLQFEQVLLEAVGHIGDFGEAEEDGFCLQVAENRSIIARSPRMRFSD